MRTTSTTPAGVTISRRRLTQAAWAAPVILATTAVPAYAASVTVPTTEASFFAWPTAAEDPESSVRRPSLGLWFGAPEDLSTGQSLGGTVTLAAGSTFTLTITMKYAEGQTPTGPDNWPANGGTKEYPATGGLVEFGPSEVNSVPVRLDFSAATVTDTTWQGSVTATTLADVSAIGDSSELGSSVLIAPGLSLDTEHLDAGSMTLSPGVGSFLVLANGQDPKTMLMSEVRPLVFALKDISFDGPIESWAKKG